MAMQENHTKNVEASTCRVSEKFYLENTLLRVSGALFCHDAKRAGTRIQTIEINRGDEEKRIVIEPHPNRGQPGPLAHKIFVALIKKHSDYGRPIPDEVSFTKREIMNLVGRSRWGGSASTGHHSVRGEPFVLIIWLNRAIISWCVRYLVGEVY